MKRLYALALVLACHATAADVEQTLVDAAVDGACIAGALITGGDPSACNGATDKLIVDIANDVEAKQQLTTQQRSNVEAGKLAAVSRLASKAPGK